MSLDRQHRKRTASGVYEIRVEPRTGSGSRGTSPARAGSNPVRRTDTDAEATVIHLFRVFANDDATN